MSGPGMLHLHAGKLRKPAVELLLHDPCRPGDMAGTDPAARCQRRAGPGDDPVAPLPGVDAPHGRAHRVGWRDAPAVPPSEPRQRIAVQLRRHHRVEKQLHQSAPFEAEAFEMAVDGQDHPTGADPTAWRLHPPRIALARERRHRARLVQAHALADETRGETADIARGLQHHRAGRVETGAVVPRPCQGLHRLPVEQLAAFAQRSEMGRVAFVMGMRRIAGRAVQLAGTVEVVGVDLILRDRRIGKADGLSVQGDHGPVVAGAGVVVRRQLMRQVDHETRVAPRRAFGDALRLEHDDARPRFDLPRPTRRRKTGKARADDHDVGRARALQWHVHGRGAEKQVPSRRPRKRRKSVDPEVLQFTASFESSDRSIQMVLIWVY